MMGLWSRVVEVEMLKVFWCLEVHLRASGERREEPSMTPRFWPEQLARW